MLVSQQFKGNYMNSKKLNKILLESTVVVLLFNNAFNSILKMIIMNFKYQ